MSQQLIYLDHAATTPVDERVLEVMQPYFRERFYNPSALYTPAREIKKRISQARGQVAEVLGAKSAEIIFTAGATESINLAVQGLARRFPKAHALTSTTEHEAVLNSLEAAFAETTRCPANKAGLVDLDFLQNQIKPETCLISIHYANNEIGTIQPLSEIAEIVGEARKQREQTGNQTPLLLHTDASQAANFLNLSVDSLGVDLMTLNGSKMYGPKQAGCLYLRSGVELEPLVYGGGQERGLRSGTENVAGVVGFAKALELAASKRQKNSKQIGQWRDRLQSQLEENITNLQVNGSAENRIVNNLHVSIPDISGETLVHHLDREGILAATGAACSANKNQPSHVLEAIGLTGPEIEGSIRFSLGLTNTEGQIKKAAGKIPEVVEEVRKLQASS